MSFKTLYFAHTVYSYGLPGTEAAGVYSAGNVTDWGTVSFWRRTVLHGVSCLMNAIFWLQYVQWNCLPAVVTTNPLVMWTPLKKESAFCMHAVGASPLQTSGDVTQACCCMELIGTTDKASGNRNEFFYLLVPFHQQLLKSRLETPLMSLVMLTSLRTRTDQVCIKREGGVWICCVTKLVASRKSCHLSGSHRQLVANSKWCQLSGFHR